MITALALLLASAQPLTPAAEEAAIRNVLADYLQGQATGDRRYYEKVFHPSARLTGSRNGRFEERSLADYLAMQSGRPAADEAKRKRRIGRILLAGQAATAEILLDYPAALTTDHMALVKGDQGWRIVHKLYNVQAKATPAR